MELVEPLWPRLGHIRIQEAQRLRDRLGRHHDLAVLAALAGPHQPLAPWRARLAPAIAARQADHIETGDAPGWAFVRRKAEGVLPAHDCVVARQRRKLIEQI